MNRAVSAVVVALCAFAAHGDLAEHVDPFVGTSGTGHAFPGACVPFGLVQASPDTGNFNWHHCSGYRHEEEKIVGFSQTHLNGTGWMDFGDAMLMPVRGDAKRPDFPASRKSAEKASPGFYRVSLAEADADVEVTASEHVGFYSIRFRGPTRKQVLIDCQYGIAWKQDLLSAHVLTSAVGLVGHDAIVGSVTRTGWVTRTYSFKAVFSKPWSALEKLPPRDNRERADRYLATFDLCEDEPLLVKVGISAFGGVAGAEKNLRAEVPGWNFEAVRTAAREKWNAVLGRAVVDGSDEQKRNFYTSLYHLCIQPNDLADVGEASFYSTLSCWDTFRAASPLYTLLVPDRVPGMVDSMLRQGRRTGYLPIWTLWGVESQGMIGTHSVPMIVDAFLKGLGGSEGSDYWERAYAQVKETLTKPHDGRKKERWDLLDRYGYYPFDEIKGESVSRTLECSYDDWCAGVMAEKLGHAEDAAFFFKRSANWRNVFDLQLGWMRGRDSKGNWRTPFDPYEFGHGAAEANDFTEGNTFQYTWHVMQDVTGLIAAMGGKKAFAERLDSVFAAPDRVKGSGSVCDVTGLIGQYVHGNEPSHHIPYLYQYADRPDRTAEIVREVFDRFYRPAPDGLCGNDDCGQMSAWYVFSALGFYPVNPCGGEYVLGAPQVPKAEIKVRKSGKDEQLRTFSVVAKNLSKENKYVKSVTLNGKAVTNWKVRHSDIVNGGELVFEMANVARRSVALCLPHEER